MSLKWKILIRNTILTVFIILAMSLTYYYLFTKDIRERSQQNVAIAYELIFDDVQKRIDSVMSKIAHFVQGSLVNPLYVVQMFQEQQKPSQEVTVWYAKKLMTYLSTIAGRIREFGILVEASQISLHGKTGDMLAVFYHEGDTLETGVFLPNVNAEEFIPIQPGDKWYAGLRAIGDIPFQPVPPHLTRRFAGQLPEEMSVQLSALQSMMTLRFVVPVINRGKVEGACVIHLSISQQDVERYARLSGLAVNIFSGTTLSAGTLPDYTTLSSEALASALHIEDVRGAMSVPETLISMKVGLQAYYQGTLVFENEGKQVGAISVHLPRQLEQAQKQRFLLTVAAIGLLFSVVAIGEAFGLSRTIVKPIATLMRAMKAMQSGNLDARADITTKDELQTLSEAFHTMGQKLKESIKQREEQQRLKKEMELARRIQTAILPKDIQHDNLQIEATMLTADEVGGDYYDVLHADDGTLWLGIGDVSGHGVTPGLIMMMAQTIHATVAIYLHKQPSEIVNIINSILYHNVKERLAEDHFMTFTALKYLGKGRFVYAGAHLTMLLYRQATQTCERIVTDGIFLNFIEDISHITKDFEFTMEAGDTLILYTDGLTEAFNHQNEMLDITGFQEIVMRHASQPLQLMRDAIMEDVLAWCNYLRADDMTLLLVRLVH